MKNLTNEVFDTIIIGGGPAGLSASLYLKRAGLNVLIIEKEIIGGKVNNTDIIENFLIGQKIKGFELSNRFKNQVDEMQINYLYKKVEKIEKNGSLFTVSLNKFDNLKSKSIIIATGTVENKLDAINADIYFHKGISYCGVCDGPLYRNKKIAVIGGGYAAIEEALFLSEFASDFYLIHRSEKFRVPKNIIDKLKNKKNVNFILNHSVKEVIGDEKLEKIILINNDNGKIKELEIDALFPYIGQKPITDFISNLDILDSRGYVIVDQKLQTKINGLFAAGDIIGRDLKQIAIAVSDGSISGQNVIKYLQDINEREI